MQHKNNYYNRPLAIQWIFAILLLAVGLSLTIPLLIGPFGLLWLPLIAPVFNLSTVPLFKLIGYFKYLNPFVLSTVQTDKQYDLHNVFTFDYLIHFKWSDRGLKVQRTLLMHYFMALITIIERIESGILSPKVIIVGHSYFFSERTAEKLGFKVSKASFFWIANSAIQFIELSSLYSFSQGKWAMPKFWKVKRAEILGSELVKKKEVLMGLVKRIETRL